MIHVGFGFSFLRPDCFRLHFTRFVGAMPKSLQRVASMRAHTLLFWSAAVLCRFRYALCLPAALPNLIGELLLDPFLHVWRKGYIGCLTGMFRELAGEASNEIGRAHV